MSSPHTRPASQKRRRSQVYVEVPALDTNTVDRRAAAEQANENSPLKPVTNNTDMAHSVSLVKRKARDDDGDDIHDSPLPKSKRAKVIVEIPQGTVQSGKQKTGHEGKSENSGPTGKASEDLDCIYCHQCGKKRDRNLTIQCTRLVEGAKGRMTRCAMKYCMQCLNNRYDTRLEELKASGSGSPTKKQHKGHVPDEQYMFKCYRCQGVCNCPTCQKKRGEEPLGNIAVKARQAEKAAAVEKHGETSQPKKGKKSTSKKAAQDNSNQAEASTSTEKVRKPRTQAKAKAPKPKPIPKPVWTAVPTSLSLSETEDRILIREFVQRFSDALQISTGHLEELDELSAESLGDTSSWDGYEEPIEIHSWVSELSAKAIILGLVETLATHAGLVGDGDEAATAKEAARAIRASGANLNRVWAALAALKDAYPALDFCDPLPPPSTTIIRQTRSGMQNGADSVHIASSAQLVPVIADLVGLAMQTSPIHEALETGVAQEKDFAKEVKEAVAKENASWKERTESKDKASREQHHQILQDLEYSGRLASSLHAPRFVPLGRDGEGRIYYAMSPGAGECEAAVELVRGKDGRVRVGKRKGMWTEDDRGALHKWAWFVAVWGKKPDDALVAKSPNHADHEDSEEEEDDDDSERWWCFWQPEEITKLSEWIAVRAHLPEEVLNEKSKRAGSADTARSAARPVNSAKTNGVVARKGSSSKSRKSNASSSLTSLTSKQSSRELSPLSDLSSDDEDDGTQDDSLRLGPLHERELGDLVRRLRDYADMLDWRIRRVTREVDEKDRKSPGAKVDTVSAKKFYS